MPLLIWLLALSVLSAPVAEISPQKNAVVKETAEIQQKQKDRGQQTVEQVFAKVKVALPGKTRVPVRLPSFLPYLADQDNELHAILKLANPQSYKIEIAFAEDCEGSNACHYGTIRGSSSPLVEEDRPRTPVILKGGIKGYFIDAVCGAHCDDSALGWKENGYYYSISMKAEKKAVLVKVVNSAIVSTS